MQKKSNTYRILTLSLAFMMFFTSVGFSMDVHFCQGEIESVAFLGFNAECEMMDEPIVEISNFNCNDKSPSTDKCHHEDSVNQSKCCHNETISVDITDDASSDIFYSSLDQLTFLTVFVLSSYTLFFTEEKVESNFYYPPPLISKDITVLYQVFII